MTSEDIHARLNGIEQQIDTIRHRLELKGIMNADHKVTENELRERVQLLRKRLERQEEHTGAHKEADALDLALNRWVDGTDLEYKA